jgi:hypothetical protein
MFKVGKFYKIVMWEDSDDGGLLTTYAAAKVLEVSFPLVKFEMSHFADGSDVIINTASLAFVRAHEVDG